MSPRWLKTKFPCGVCGRPAEVVRLRESAHAICEPCANARQVVGRIGAVDWLAAQHIKAAVELRDNADAKPSLMYLPATPSREEAEVVEWLEAAISRASSASRAVQAISLHKGADRRRYAKIAQNRAGLAQSILAQLAEHLSDLVEKEGHGLKVVEAIPAAPEQLEMEPGVEVPRPALRLVKRGDT